MIACYRKQSNRNRKIVSIQSKGKDRYEEFVELRVES